jgi:hypothetical protein
MKNKLTFFMVALMATFLMTSCADVSHIQDCLPENEHTYGFWAGAWHGLIMVFSFIGSLFSDNIAVYAVNNNGAWYDFGFVGGFWFLLRLIGVLIKALRE